MNRSGDAVPLGRAVSGNYVVVSLSGGKGFTRKLGSMGLYPNAELRVISSGRSGPVRISVKGVQFGLGRGMAGRITSIRGEDAKLVARIEELTSIDEEASIVGELGIGINPEARVTGNMLEDEKAVGTVHVAFGNNIEMGGKNSSRTHRDFHMLRPNLTIEFEDGQTREIIRDGRLLD